MPKLPTSSPNRSNTNVGRRCGQIYKTIKLKVMGYFSWKEDEAYREGRNDYSYGRRNYDYDEHFGGDADKAYYDGRRDEERKEEQRREMYEEKRRQEERQERKQLPTYTSPTIQFQK